MLNVNRRSISVCEMEDVMNQIKINNLILAMIMAVLSFVIGFFCGCYHKEQLVDYEFYGNPEPLKEL